MTNNKPRHHKPRPPFELAMPKMTIFLVIIAIILAVSGVRMFGYLWVLFVYNVDAVWDALTAPINEFLNFMGNALTPNGTGI